MLHKLAGRVRAEAWEAVDLRGVQCRHIRHPHLVQESLLCRHWTCRADTNLPTDTDHDVVGRLHVQKPTSLSFRKI